MLAPEVTTQESYVPRPFAASAESAALGDIRADGLAALAWAGVASTLHRVRRGEGALLAVNLSLVAYGGGSVGRAAILALVSTLAIMVMYAFNDLWDAPTDWENPKKDRALVATYVGQRRTAALAILVLSILTVAIALVALDPWTAAAVAGVMLVNYVYSTVLKGVPVIDVAWCGVWGLLYAAIVGAPASLLVFVGLMTSVCHLFQTLDDRVADAAVGITTTAVRSATLSRNVLFVLLLLIFVVMRSAVGTGIALTAFTPLLFFFVATSARAAWLSTKVYFGLVWLHLLGTFGALG